MNKKFGVLIVFLLFVVMLNPAYSDVTSLTLREDSYTSDEDIVFTGIEHEGKKAVFVIIEDASGEFVGMVADPSSDENGAFTTTSMSVSEFSRGLYNATAFSGEQKKEDGFIITLEFDGDEIFVVPNFELELETISDKTIEEEKTLSFTVNVTDDTLEDVKYSLDKNVPSGASINADTGEFTWTPSTSQGTLEGIEYKFDIVAKKSSQEDRQEITITVIEPEPEPKDEPEPEPKDNTLEIPAPFVKESKDPQSYVDRYMNEPTYKEWFDENYPEYSSIYQAVGLEEPINEEPETEVPEEPQIGICGPGTKLVGDTCQIVKEQNTDGGGCLIATAAYGSELAPQVQLLREIRDGKVMETDTGSAFMESFNQFYYSFSPYIADYERENPVFKEAVKLGITPMLASLSILNAAEIDSELDMLGYGIGIILMNVGMYVGMPASLIYYSKKWL